VLQRRIEGVPKEEVVLIWAQYGIIQAWEVLEREMYCVMQKKKKRTK
jgi:hypothetical protein